MYALDELFFVFQQLNDENIDACHIIAWDILNVVQHRCTERCGEVKPKDWTLGDAYPRVNQQDPGGLELLAWAIYDGALSPGSLPELTGCQDWN